VSSGQQGSAIRNGIIEEVAMFKGKKVIIVGERDGVPGPAIAKCVEAAGGTIVFMTTECFV
jgi:glycine/sarcosine/betaine reductase complex component A